MEPSNLTGSTGAATPVPSGPDPQLEASFRNGASWFFWLAGLSLVNSAIGWFGGNTRFLFGLGVTEFVNGLAKGMNAGIVLPAVLDVLIVGVFVAFGAMAQKKSKLMFMLGLIIYALDLVLCLIFQDWLFVLFHAWVIWQLIRGFKALSTILEFEQQVAPGLSSVRTD